MTPRCPPPPRLGALVVADESVYRLLEAALRPLAFAVFAARTSRQAVELYAVHHAAIAVVLLDLRLPDLDGPATLASLREVDPGVRCCFLSEDSGGAPPERLLALGDARYFPRPFLDLDQLGRDVLAVAEGRPTSAGSSPSSPPSPSSGHDARLRGAAQACLRASGHRTLGGLRCDARDGVVTVTGAVRSYYLRQVAQTCLRNLDGARQVRLLVEVRGTARPR